MTVTIRAATEADAEAICVIHNQGIVDRTATLDTALRTPAERRQWLNDREARHIRSSSRKRAAWWSAGAA
jgi:L-amino acid N-acyltransferase YncA